MWAQEKGQPSPGWHSRCRRPAGQPASEAAPASVPSSGPAALAASCAHPAACLCSPWRPPPDRPTTPSRTCPSGPVPRPLLRSPHTSAQPESTSFLLHLPITGLGKGQPVGMAWERSKGTCESGSKAKVGISSVGVSRAEPGLGLTSADLGAADAAQAGGLGQGGRAQRREHSCSPPLHETLPSSQGPQEPRTSQHGRMPATQVLGTRKAASEDRALPASPRALLPGWQSTPSLAHPPGSPVVTRSSRHLPGLQVLPGAEPRPCGPALVLRDP